MTNQVQISHDVSTQDSSMEGSLAEIARKDLSEIITPAQLRLILITREMHEETIHMLAEVFEHVLL